MLEQFRNIFSYQEMLRNIVLRELRARYKGSFFGFLWTFFNPLLMLTIYSLVFSFILKTEIKNYPMFIFVALLPWNYFVNSVLQGSTCLIQNGGLLKKIYFPREVLPLSVVFTHLINYVLTLIVLIPALLFFGVEIKLTIISFPIVLIVETLFVIFVVMLVSVFTVYLRDLEHILGVFLMAGFYLTPVLFPITMIPDKFRWVFQLNPFAPLIDSYRDLFLYGNWPDFYVLFKLALILIILNIVAFKAFSRLQRNVAEEI